jgi:hypothetical protein
MRRKRSGLMPKYLLYRTIFFALLLIGLCFLLTPLFVSCATAKPFPPQNIVIYAPIPSGTVYIRILKGQLDEEHRGKSWMTEKDFIDLRFKGKISEEFLEEDL